MEAASSTQYTLALTESAVRHPQLVKLLRRNIPLECICTNASVRELAAVIQKPVEG